MLIAAILPKIGLQIGNHSWPCYGPGGCQNGQPAAVNIHPSPPNTKSKVDTQSSRRPYTDSPRSTDNHPRNFAKCKTRAPCTYILAAAAAAAVVAPQQYRGPHRQTTPCVATPCCPCRGARSSKFATPARLAPKDHRRKRPPLCSGRASRSPILEDVEAAESEDLAE